MLKMKALEITILLAKSMRKSFAHEAKNILPIILKELKVKSK